MQYLSDSDIFRIFPLRRLDAEALLAFTTYGGLIVIKEIMTKTTRKLNDQLKEQCARYGYEAWRIVE